MKRFLLLAALILSAWCNQAPAQSVPALINYQGQIQNPNGTSPSTADYELTFRIYDAASGGSVVWGPQIFNGQSGPGLGAKVPVVQGYFNVLLGQVDTLNRSIATAFSNNTRFLEIKVGTNPPITPRQQLLSSPFALQAENAANSQKLADFDWSAIFGMNSPTGKIAGTKLTDGSVTGAQIADRTISITKLELPIIGTNVPVGGIALSQTASFITSSSIDVTINEFNLTLQATGRPVAAYFCAGSPTGGAYFEAFTFGSEPARAWISLWRNGFMVGEYLLENLSGGSPHNITVPSSSIRFFDIPPPGKYDYSVRLRCDAGNRDTRIINSRLIVHEQ